MMVLGVGELWGQTLQEGFYYIANGNKNSKNASQYDNSDKTKNYYLTSATGKYYKDNNGTTTAVTTPNETPFLTTYMSFKNNASSGALWEVKKIVSDNNTYYQFIHVEDGKYLTVNPYIEVTGGYRRVSVHLEANPTDEDKTLFVVTQVSGQSYYTICHKDVEESSLNPASNNYDQTDPTTGGGGYGGLIGWGNSTGDTNSFWYFEEFTLSEPTINVDVAEAKFSITTAETIPTGCSVRYTTGDGTQTAPTATTGIVYKISPNTPVAIDDFTNVKAAVVGHQLVLTDVADEPVKCATPVFSFSQNTNIYDVTVETATSGATLYYTIGTNPADPAASEGGYDGTGSSPLEIPNVTSTIKVIAAKEGLVNSPVLAFVANPTISLEYDTHAYAGIELEPSVSINGGSIPSSEYLVTYSNNKNVGTATATVENKPGSNYYVIGGSVNFEITKASLTITAEAKSKFYGDDDPALTYISEGLVGSDAVTGSLSRETGENVGTYAIHQNTLTASSNYDISYIGANLTITPKTLTITAKPQNITYGEEPANDGVTYSGFVGEEDESVLSGTLAYTYDYEQYDNAGDYAITPSGLTGDNYDISFVAGTLTVNPKEVGLTWDETTSFVYDASNHAPTATPIGLLNGDEVGVNVTGQQKNVGEDYIATASGLTGNKAGSYTLTETYTKNFSITPAALIVTAKNHTISYGDTPRNNGVDYDGFAGEDNAEVLGGTLTYAYNYEQYDELGDYTITPSGLTSTNYSISYHTGTLTVKKKTIILKWTNTLFIYDREAHRPEATVAGTVNSELIGVTVTAPTAVNAGNYTATASELTGEQVGHYELPTINTRVFSIAPKSLGNGDLPTEDITIGLTPEGELDYVKDGEITLTTDVDYTYEIHDEGSDQIVAVTGKGNYTGSLRGIYAQPQFYDTGGSGAGKNVAVYMSSRDVNTFAGVKAYTVKSVNTFLGLVTVNELEYIPKDVPVLLLSASETTGFVVTEKDESKADISEGTVNSNLLKMAPAEGVPVETAQVYIFYNGEFVLTKAGTITEGKFYLYNPNYTDTSDDPDASPARGTLLIVEEDPTGMAALPHTANKPANDVWYTLDGRRLSSKPTTKGLYIHNGCKEIVK